MASARGFSDPSEALLSAITQCLKRWGDDPAYSGAAQKLREVERELDVLLASPGQRAAKRASTPNQSGQNPS